MEPEYGEWIPKGELCNGTHYILSNGDESCELIVTIHGIDGFSYTFDNLVEAVKNRNNSETNAKKYRVLQYDLIGRGHSEPNKSNLYTEREHIMQLRNLVEFLGFNKAKNYHIIGISMGGALAALYCEQYHTEVKSLTLLAPAGLMHLPELEFVRAIPLLGWLVKYPLHWMEIDPKNSRTFYNKSGVFNDRFEHMFKMKHLALKHNPHQLEATWQSKLQFPVIGIEDSVSAVSNLVNFPIHLVFGKFPVRSYFILY